MKRTLLAVLLTVAGVGCGGDPGTAGCPHPLPTCPSPAPSFQSRVGPLITSRCGGCHAWTTYDSVFASRASMQSAVAGCRMPRGTPLTDAEVKDLLGWFACGAPNN